VQYPDSASGKEAARTLLNWNQNRSCLKLCLAKTTRIESQSLDESFVAAHAQQRRPSTVMEQVFMDKTKDADLRKLAVRTFGGPWESEDQFTITRSKKIKFRMICIIAASMVCFKRHGAPTSVKTERNT
jgi:hypothetical protein